MAVMGLLLFALLNHILSLKANGVWIIFQSTFLLVDTFRSGFLSTAFVKFYAGKTADEAKQVAGSAWFIAICITAFFLVLNIPGYYLAQHIADEGLSLFFKWFGLAFLAGLPYLMAVCITQAEERFDRLLLLRVVNQILFIGGILVCYFRVDMGIEHIVFAYVLSFALTSVFAMFMGWTNLSALKFRNHKATAALFNFGKYSVGTILSVNLFRTIDIFVINTFLSASVVAVYNLGLRLMEVIEIPLRSLVSSGMPMMVAAFNREDKKGVIAVMRQFIGMLTIAMVPILFGVILFADLPIALLGGGKYMHTEAANVLRIFMCVALFFPADRFISLTLDVIHKPQVNFYKILIMLVVNLVAAVLGAYFLQNIYGVVLASFFPVVVAIIIGYRALQQYFRFGFFQMYISGYKDLKTQLAQWRKR